MRRVSLLLAALAAVSPLFAAAPAEASITCAAPYESPNDILGRQPFCSVWCAMTLDLRDPCWIQD